MRPLELRGARTNNLRAIDLDFAPGALVVIAGPSGAGKSSLAFSTLYAEGQRRYVESFSAYARQFLERLARPPVDKLEPVPPAIAVDREAPVKTSRSTVGTMTEMTDYAKGLWARVAEPHCPKCGEPVRRDPPTEAADAVIRRADGKRVSVFYPLEIKDAEHFVIVREGLVADGYRRVRIAGEVRDLDQVKPSDLLGAEAPRARVKKAPSKSAAKKAKKTSSKKAGAAATPTPAVLDVLADRATGRVEDRARIVEAIEAAMRKSGGRADVSVEGGDNLRFSRGLHCASCDLSFRDATPGTFSFNSPIGACETCRGFGRTIGVDWERVFPDAKKTLAEGAVRPWGGASTQWERTYLAKHAKAAGVPMDVPYGQLSDAHKRWLIDGDGRGWQKGFAGLKGWFEWLESRAYKMHVRVLLSRYRSYDTCRDCQGSRLKVEAGYWRIDGRTITDFYASSITDALAFVRKQARVHREDAATSMILRECEARLGTLFDVGLGYLTLDRPSRTLSGGEAQRVALTSALGASLTGAMFVLDEPTVGLHPSDVGRLIDVVKRLRSGENLVLVVEHDAAFLRAADRVIELGPGAGEHGGQVVFDGAPKDLARAKTATGRALSPPTPAPRALRKSKGTLRIKGASAHNLVDVDLEIPAGVLTCVTGVSGSGKSTLILDTFFPAFARAIGQPGHAPLPYRAIEGRELLRGAVRVDQAALGRTSRGNPATYLKAWDVIRKRFASEKLAKAREYGPGFFSFNVSGGRCEACRGEGAETVEMQFLADVTFSCPECGGKRFVGPVLEVEVRGKNVADVLAMTATEALLHFEGDAELARVLGPLIDVGAGYLRLGQPLSTLSGGEAQRLKLAEALSLATPGSLVVLDEPTAGLHNDEVTPLLKVFDALVDRGDTVVVVEHDMRVAAHADHVIDLGPGPGEEGGRIVAAGPPKIVAKSAASRTAPFLAEALGTSPDQARGTGTNTAKGTGTDTATGTATPTAAVLPHHIQVFGAREHNLKNVSANIPRGKLVVVTGPSGSGKSTLTFDVVHAEAQRRYLETLSPYARQYLPQLPRPSVDRVIGLPPSVALEQRVTRGGGNSTVATVTEIAHYLRVLYARAGLLHCVDCRVPIAPRQPAALAGDVRARFGKTAEITVLAPVVRGRKGNHREILDRALKDGYREARIDGQVRELTRGLSLERFKEHDVEIVITRARAADPAFDDGLRKALALGDGAARVSSAKGEMMLSTKRACPSCGKGYPELDPRFFSFNTRQGACEPCEGKGVIEEEVGRGKAAHLVESTCEACAGTRLSPLARSVTIAQKPITELLSLGVAEAKHAIHALTLEGREAEVGKSPLAELRLRLEFLDQVGLGYLGLDRAAATLSGGETQRVRLAAQLGSGLTGVLYVLDEPTIGLHPRDTGRLLRALRQLVDKGCSVLVVEHDSDTIRAADHLIDVGPGGGKHGGHIVAEGPAASVLKDPASVTGVALHASASLRTPRKTTTKSPHLELLGAREHNLQDVSVRFPLGRLVAITGVSGSGKSTLVRDVLLPATRKALGLEADEPGDHDSLRGTQAVKRAVEIDQSPIGRTPRSVPATYIGVWDELRKLLAQTPDARARGYGPSRFSFNVAEGRCPSCEGQGALAVEMAFLPEVLVPCEACGGARFTPETRDIKLAGLSASELLDLDVSDAAVLLAPFPKVARPLALLADLGLGYLKLGQASNTLSGGEAQRLKLVAELAVAGTSGPTLYVMDEPTTGLHRTDVVRLIRLLEKLVDRGDTVVVIEHHPDVMLAADWIIDMGPEGGTHGGRVVAEGTPEELSRSMKSHTAEVLRREMAEARAALQSDGGRGSVHR